MTDEANKLLMMYIVDGYRSQTGKISKKTAIATMKYVGGDKKLRQLVNIGDYKEVLKHKTIAHGINCNKVTHADGGGYLHFMEDDSPYDVDGCSYCGRCHEAI